MINTGPLILLDDDRDDLDICIEILREIGVRREIVCFNSSTDVFHYLLSEGKEVPFLILSDINLPVVDGIQLKKMIDANPVLRKKSIPFVFYSTSGDDATVNRAYAYDIQGFFIKQNSYDAVKANLEIILAYWLESKHPKKGI